MSSQIAEVIETANHIINFFLNHRAIRVPFEETRKKLKYGVDCINVVKLALLLMLLCCNLYLRIN